MSNGLFGFTSYDAIQHFEDIKFSRKTEDFHIPQLYYALYQNVIAINVFNNEAHLYAHCFQADSNLDEVVAVLQAPNPATHSFSRQGEPQSNLTDDEFVELVKKGIYHCYRGDVFQIVLSRRFSQDFVGDDFTLYRVLRSVNPSPIYFILILEITKFLAVLPRRNWLLRMEKQRFIRLRAPFAERATTSKMPNVQLNWQKTKKKIVSM